MSLILCWTDSNGIIYKLGNLYKKEDKYNFDIFEEALKSAIINGCFGIGNFDLLYNHYESSELFDFFKQRIPSINNVNIKNILEQLGMSEYNDMELLIKTKGRLVTDRYYLEKDYDEQ